MERHELVDKLAAKFGDMLRAEVGDADYAEIVRANKLTGYHECASHDYCDSNMVMDAAFRDLFGREANVCSTQDCGIWNDAWDLWKEHESMHAAGRKS